ncbi:MAG: thioredoxin-like domain-containing protein [Acidiferrobacter sp.]
MISPSAPFDGRYIRRGRLRSAMRGGLLLMTLIALPAAATRLLFPHGAPWFNVSQPLTSRQVQGRFVLLDFFTPGCINCIQTIPGIAQLQRRYARDLVVIGVNSPKFRASRHDQSVRDFLIEYHVTHPVVTDVGFRLWHAYRVFAWPTFVLIGPRGHLRHVWIGQGHHRAISRFIAVGLRADAPYLHPQPLPLIALPTRPPLLAGPEKVAVGRHYVAVADTLGNRILLFNHHGRLQHIIGTGQAGATNGPAAQATFNHPQGLAFRGPMLLVADTFNNEIRAINTVRLTVRTIAGDGREGYSRGGPIPRQVRLNAPWGLLAVGPVLYIAMAGDHQVWRYNLAHQTIAPWAGNGAEGLTNGPRRQALFAQCSGLSYHRGTLYVADAESSSVRVIRGGRVSTIIGRGLFHFGYRNGPARHALLQHDQGLAYLGHDLYIADTFNDAIRCLDLRTDMVTTVAGDGRPGNAVGAARGATLNQPGGLAVLNRHTLLIADTGNNRILALHLRRGSLTDWTQAAP